MYKVTFNYKDSICVLDVDDVYVSEMMGFIQVSGIKLEESKIDKKYIKDFKDILSSHIPVRNVQKVDEIHTEDETKNTEGANITLFPGNKSH